MKAVQIKNYSKNIETQTVELSLPSIKETEVLIQVKAAAVNPVDLLNMNGSIKLIQDYPKPITLGNECSGIVVKIGNKVKRFKEDDHIYTRLPIEKIGAFAEYVAVEEDAIALMPKDYTFVEAATIPLTGLTAYQAIVEELEAKAGESLLITGGSGSFGQMAVPIAKELGLKVIITGNPRAKDDFLAMGVDQYIDYTKENYWEILQNVDHVIDTLGEAEFNHEMSVLKKGGRLVSLRLVPNRAFAIRHGFTGLKKMLFSIAGKKYDKVAKEQGKEYRFLFVRADGNQLKKITEIVEKNEIKPAIDSHTFTLEQANEALNHVRNGKLKGKVIIEL